MTAAAIDPVAAAIVDGGGVATERPYGIRPPLAVTAVAANLRHDPEAAIAWFRTRRQAVEQASTSAGAVLFRGFALPDTAAFDRWASLFPAHADGYAGGASPRASVGQRVWESTRFPADARLVLHQEKSYMPHPPRRIAFFCERPAAVGGETIIGDMRAVTRRLEGSVLDRFAARGVAYFRNFLDPEAAAADRYRPLVRHYHRSWRDAFGAGNRTDVDAACAAAGLARHWLPDGSVTVIHLGGGVCPDPLGGSPVWFNQAAAHHPNVTALGPFAEFLKRRYADRSALPYNVTYADGRPLPESDLAPAYQAFDAETVAFPWQAGDVLLIDNIAVAHGRNPFRGERVVRVAMFD